MDEKNLVTIILKSLTPSLDIMDQSAAFKDDLYFNRVEKSAMYEIEHRKNQSSRMGLQANLRADFALYPRRIPTYKTIGGRDYYQIYSDRVYTPRGREFDRRGNRNGYGG